MNAAIQRTGDRVWLEDVAGWSPREKASSVHAALEAVMKAVGEDISYDDLLGVSSAAFRMQVGGLCPSSPHPCCGYNCIDRAMELLPWKIREYASDRSKNEELFQVVARSIDRGIPVTTGEEEDGLVVGYGKENKDFICLHPWRNDGRETFAVPNLADICWGICVYTERKIERCDRRGLVIDSLTQAVQMANAERDENYCVGFKAWDAYIETLQSLDERKVKDEEALGNAWIFSCLVQCRAVAARYLSQIENYFDDRANDHLRNASASYRRMAQEILAGGKQRENDELLPPDVFQLSSPSLADGEDFEKSPSLSHLPQKGKSWTKEMRREQIGRLQAALPLERHAIEEIEKALAAIQQ